MHPQRVRLDEFEVLLSEVDGVLVWQDRGEVPTPRQDIRERCEGPVVQRVDRLAPRRGGPTVRRVCRDPIEGPRRPRAATRVRNDQVRRGMEGVQRRPGSPDHTLLRVRADPTEADAVRLEQDPPGPAERIEDRPARRDAGQVHEGPGELRMEGDRTGEGPVSDLGRLEVPPGDSVHDASEDEFVAHQKPQVDARGFEVDLAGAAHIGAQGAFEGRGVHVHVEPTRSNPERRTDQVHPLREISDVPEVPSHEFLRHKMRKAEPTGRPLHGARRVDGHELRGPRDGPEVRAFRLEGRENLRAREGRMLAGDLDEDAHTRGCESRFKSLTSQH